MVKSSSVIRLYLATAILAAALTEGSAFLAIRFLLEPHLPSYFFRRPVISEVEFDKYQAIRDPLLGWPARKTHPDGTDAIVSRFIPSYPVAGSECVSLYGDSFTHGDDVDDSEAWSNVLSTKLGCRVANYGIGGYGTDQAYLRYAKNADDRAKLVILGIFPDNVMRNVNQYRYFLDGQTVFSLKPRFILDGDRLELIKMPSWNLAEFTAATRNPDRAFLHEAFLPNSSNGPVTPVFPYSMRAIRLLLSERIRSGLLGHTSWEVFYSHDHPTQALRVTVGIVELFARTCGSRGQICLVIIYPSGRSFREFKRTGRIATSPLTDELAQRGIEHLDLHRPFGQRVGEQRFCELLTQPTGCVGHFNAAGNEAVADIIYQQVKPSVVPRPPL